MSFPVLYHNGKTFMTDKCTSCRDGLCSHVEHPASQGEDISMSLLADLSPSSVPSLFFKIFITTTMPDEQLCEIILQQLPVVIRKKGTD